MQNETVTYATITFQNYFRMYTKLAGMTGTAATEKEEFAKIYNREVTMIPTNRPVIRIDNSDLIYRTEDAKFRALINEIRERSANGQPILVGTTSVETSERLSALLKREKIKHQVLNAKQNADEARIIAQAATPVLSPSPPTWPVVVPIFCWAATLKLWRAVILKSRA